MDLVKDTNKKEPLRIVLYATNGVGKSTWASNSPSPLFLDIENGLTNIEAKAINLHSIPMIGSDGNQILHKVEKIDNKGNIFEEEKVKTRPSNFEDLMKILRSIYKEPVPFKTLVIDSIDWVQDHHIHPKVADEYKVKDISDIGFQNGYKKAMQYWKELIGALNILRSDKDLNIIILAHSAKVKENEAGLDPHDVSGIKIHKFASDFIREWADFVLFAKFDKNTIQKEAEFGNKKTKAIGGKERVLITKHDPNSYVKSRFDIPEKLPLEWAAFEAAYNESINQLLNKGEYNGI